MESFAWGPEPDIRLIQWGAIALKMRYFPWGQFDANGLIKDPIPIPDDHRRHYVDAQHAPVWNEIQLQLNLLQTPGWGCHSVAIGFEPRGIRLMPVKSLGSVANAEAGALWAEAFHQRVLQNVQDAAGKVPAIPPAWITAIQEVLRLLQRFTAEQVSSLEPGEPLNEEAVQALNASFVVALLLDLVSLAAQAQVKRNVYATTLWYSPSFTRIDPSKMGPWSRACSVRIDGTFTDRHSVGVIWDTIAQQIYAWKHGDADWGPPLFPYTVKAIRQSLYPAGPKVAAEEIAPEPLAY